MDRPVTSKSRGICRYYNTSRGCYAGDKCKFLHDAEEQLTPYDKSKVCRYYVQGHCTRGERCWFRHELLNVPIDDELKYFDENMCTICLEKPKTYGLLSGCSHVFCLQCIRQWREPQGKSSDMVVSGILKRCPVCRISSRFISPSTHFFPQDHPRKQDVIDRYRNSMARVPCKYFVETSASGKPCCPFGADCFYQHVNPDGTPHVFQYGAEHFMKVFRRQQMRHGRNSFEAISSTELADQLSILQGMFGGPTNGLRVALNFFRRHLPAIWNGINSESGTVADAPEDESTHGDDDNHEVLELLAESIAAEQSLEATLSWDPPVAHASNVDEGSSHSPVESPVNVPTVLIPPRTRSASLDMGLPVTQVDVRPSSSAEVSAPLPHSFLPWAMPRTPSPHPSSISPASMASIIQQSNTSRFSTVLNSRSQETMVIDISDEEDGGDETEENLLLCPLNVGNDHDSDNDTSPPSTSTVVDPPEPVALLALSETAEAPTTHMEEQTSPPGRPQCEHDKDPPFVTDGRGRVVWSRTIRGSQAQVERERCRSSPAVKARQTSETVIPDGRGHVVLSPEVADGISDTEMVETETETEAE